MQVLPCFLRRFLAIPFWRCCVKSKRGQSHQSIGKGSQRAAEAFTGCFGRCTRFSNHAYPSRMLAGRALRQRAQRVNPTKFLTELKRRNVYRAAVAYGVVAWFLTQLTTQVFPFFEIPNFAVRFVVIALAVGFPIAMLLAWVYEFTLEGVVRTEDLDPGEARSVQRMTGRILDFVIIGVLLLAIAMLIVGRLPFYEQPGESMAQKSIAVLPFENLSEDKANAYFTDGVLDEILNDLSRVADLKVISRTSVTQYKSGGARNLREIAKALGVTHIVEGSVQRAGGRVRVSAQLIDARTDMHIW